LIVHPLTGFTHEAERRGQIQLIRSALRQGEKTPLPQLPQRLRRCGTFP